MDNIVSSMARIRRFLGHLITSEETDRDQAFATHNIQSMGETSTTTSMTSLGERSSQLGGSISNLAGSGQAVRSRTVKKHDPQDMGKKAYFYTKDNLKALLTTALSEYLQESTKEHIQYLKHCYLQHNAIRRFLNKQPTMREPYHISNIQMPANFETFQVTIALLLDDLPQSDMLYQMLNQCFLPTDFEIKEAEEGQCRYQIIYIGSVNKEKEENKRDSNTSIQEAFMAIAKSILPSMDKQHKHDIIQSIEQTYHKRPALENCVKLLRRITDIHAKHVKWWTKPDSNTVSLSMLTTTAPTEESTLEALKALQTTVTTENETLEQEIETLKKSLPSIYDDDDEHELLPLRGIRSLESVCDEMRSLLQAPPGLLHRIRRGCAVSTLRQAYANERTQTAALLGELETLDSLFKEIRRCLWSDVDNAAWARNLMAEWLRQNLPTELCTVGRIKWSSHVRKAWKGKLEEWGIPWKPEEETCHASAVTLSCFQSVNFR